MKIGILTNEYPPNVYGGAGVHVEYLTREMAKLDNGKHVVRVYCFGNQKQDKNPEVTGIDAEFKYSVKDEKHRKFLDTILKDIVITGSVNDIDIVHCHTWYSHFAGVLVKQLHQVPLVLTTHSLEPHRPWKVEQLGSAYYGSSWIEKTAYENADGVVAVSEAMKNDVHTLYNVDYEKIRVIHNGIDLNQYKPTFNDAVLDKYKIDKKIPFILFVGRITRQKGIIHLVNAIKYLKEGIQIVLCAGAPDTKEIGIEMEEKVREAESKTKNKIIWIPEMLPKEEVIVLYSCAEIFVCPSVYEPFGIINLEAMACETPVVATNVGGIPEVVVHNETGLLVPFKSKGTADPEDPEKFSKDIADAINSLLGNKDKVKEMGIKSRKRVEEHFSWTSIAKKTIDFYDYILKRNKK
ncbi:MAG: glycogen synthase [Candidatus Goldbacteria bacterium]|nr:glycogen synthase [Candidatus Goldiibacteriota bacterium]